MSSGRPIAGSSSLLALVLALVAGAAPAVCDVLVTRDGGRITTWGPWRVDGALVVFRLDDGSLGSIRLAAVDLDASDQATEVAARPEEPASAAVEPERGPVTVVTDRDVRRADPVPPAAGEPEVAPAAGGAATADVLRVTEWSQEELPDGSGTAIVGTIENTGPDAMGRVRIRAQLYDDQGISFASRDALVDHATLMPGRKMGFRVNLPDLFAFTGVRFETKALPLAVGTPGTQDRGSPTDDEPPGIPE